MKKSRINFKKENSPRTVVEKYNKLRAKNPALDLLKKAFDLVIPL